LGETKSGIKLQDSVSYAEIPFWFTEKDKENKETNNTNPCSCPHLPCIHPHQPVLMLLLPRAPFQVDAQHPQDQSLCCRRYHLPRAVPELVVLGRKVKGFANDSPVSPRTANPTKYNAPVQMPTQLCDF
jgi:hypothetical protein